MGWLMTSVDFVDRAEGLRISGKLDEALAMALKGLSENPEECRGRLVLARIFYEKGYLPFAVREVEHLARQVPSNTALKKLLGTLAPDRGGDIPSTAAAEDTVAESEFDLDALALLEGDPKGKG